MNACVSKDRLFIYRKRLGSRLATAHPAAVSAQECRAIRKFEKAGRQETDFQAGVALHFF
jgi:hypothetical protein